MRRVGALALACVFALTSVVWAQGLKRDERTEPAKAAPAAAPAAEPAADDEKDRVHVEQADQLRYDEKKKQYVLTGHVKFRHKDTLLYCDKATYDEDNDTAEAEGALRVIDPENVCTGDHVHADFKEEIKLMIITGNVVVVHQKKEEAAAKAPANGAVKAEVGKGEAGKAAQPAAGAAKPAGDDKGQDKAGDFKKKKTTVYADKVEYWYDDAKKLAIATAERTGQVRAVQEDKTAWADKAVYDQRPEVDEITVTGNVHVKTDKGDEFRCPKAVISVKDDWMQAEGVTGVALNHRKKKGETPAAPTTGAPVAPAPGPGTITPTPAPAGAPK